MPTEARDRQLRRAVRMMRAWRAIGLMGWLFFVCSLIYISFAGRPDQARAIILNDQVLLWVQDHRVADRVLQKVRDAKGGGVIVGNVRHESAPLPPGARITPEAEAVEQLLGQLDVHVQGWKIELEGQHLVTMDTEEHAQKVLEELKARYADLKEGEKLIEQRLDPEPVIGETTVDAKQIQTDVAAAAELLQSSDPETMSYAVQQGDSPILIARKFDVRLSDLIARNPSLKQVVDGQRYLRPGEKLTIKRQRRGVKVITLKQYEEERETDLEPLPQRTPGLPAGQQRVLEPGSPKREKIRVTVTLQNGEEIGRKEDVLETLAQGERPRVLLGTGPRA